MNRKPTKPKKPSSTFSNKKGPKNLEKKALPLSSTKKRVDKKGPSRRRKSPDSNLDIRYTDKELGEISVIKRKLQEIREYKKILMDDGLVPDEEDKKRESELIVRLLRIEKNARLAVIQRAKAERTEAFRERAEGERQLRQKERGRQVVEAQDHSEDEDFFDDEY